MLKGVRDLCNGATSRGNHTRKGSKFYYHGNCVCVVNHASKTFTVDACGWDGYSSTTRTLNSYREFFNKAGYVEK